MIAHTVRLTALSDPLLLRHIMVQVPPSQDARALVAAGL